MEEIKKIPIELNPVEEEEELDEEEYEEEEYDGSSQCAYDDYKREALRHLKHL